MKRIRECKTGKRKNFNERAITLIALVVTIVIILILAAITITMTLGENGMFQRSQDAKNATIKAMADEEVELAVSNLKMETTIREMTSEQSRKFLEDELKKSDKNTTVVINGTAFEVNHRKISYLVDEDFEFDDETPFDPVEWDKTAAPENVFVWESDNPDDEGYNTIIGYNATVDNYPILRYPSRCKIIQEDSYKVYYKFKDHYYGIDSIRSYTSNIKKKEFPETVTEISGGSFYYNNVESLKLPKSLKKIGDYAFSYYSKLGGINIPKGVNTIGKYIFRNCSCLSSISILGNINQINEHAFDRYRWDDTFDVSIISIKGTENSIKGAPWGAENATIVWNNKLNKEYMTMDEKKEWDKTAVPENVFYWGSEDPSNLGYNIIVGYKENIANYPTLKYPSRCKIIVNDVSFVPVERNNSEEAYSLRNFTRNVRKLQYSDNVQFVKSVYWGINFRNVETIKFGENLKEIGEYSFFGYENLKSITIPRNVVKIGKCAFGYCMKLNEISIPASVEKVESDAFYGCDKLENIYVAKAEDSITGSPWNAKNAKVIWNSNGYTNQDFKDEMSKEYMTTEEKKEWDKTAVPEDIFYWESDIPGDEGYNTIIGYKSSISNYTVLRYPSRCKAVRDDPEWVCLKVNGNLEIGNIENIRSYTKNVKKKEYPDSVIYIAGNSFDNDNVESIRLSNNLKVIDEGAMYKLYKLKMIKIPKSVVKIGKYAFSGASNITINIKANSISDAPWGATNATINWNYTGE